MTEARKVSIRELQEQFKGSWDPKVVVAVRDEVVRVAQFHGSYGEEPHKHEYDEFFLVLEGKIEIKTERGNISLGALESAVIPAGVAHQPYADTPALVLMLDPREKK